MSDFINKKKTNVKKIIKNRYSSGSQWNEKKLKEKKSSEGVVTKIIYKKSFNMFLSSLNLRWVCFRIFNFKFDFF